MINRRDLARTLLIASAALALGPRIALAQPATPTLSPLTIDPRDPWASLPHLLARISPPRIPQRDFVITKFG
ncbi:MAG TPA: hypothetical protein VF608_04680, partial [Thermoanaerobaculia bacterium]